MSDIPDQIYRLEETRLWRPRAVVVDLSNENRVTDFRWETPIPVFSGNRCVGSATLERSGTQVVASLCLDYNIPERLDVENQTPVWALPNVLFRSFIQIREEETGETYHAAAVAEIVDLTLRHDLSPLASLPPIGTGVL